MPIVYWVPHLTARRFSKSFFFRSLSYSNYSRSPIILSQRRNMATANEAESVYDYLIIGSGIFGASTAYHLAQRYPNARTCLVDRMPYPCPLAASWDWNKVVRADYGDAFYMKFALEAMDSWR